MNYKECLAHCIERARETHKHWWVAYFEQYPIPNEREWDRCTLVVSETGRDPANPLECMKQYERILKSRGISTIPVVEAQYKRIGRRIGMPPQFVDDFIMLMQQLHGDQTIL